MSNTLSELYGLVDGKTYIIGRTANVPIEGHIYLDSPSISRQHATLVFKNRRVFLRDLKSTNGTFLIENNIPVKFEEGYVSPHQLLMIGEVSCTIQGLLTTTGVYSDFTKVNPDFDSTTKPVMPSGIPYESDDAEFDPLSKRR
jgi:hypothetical protein